MPKQIYILNAQPFGDDPSAQRFLLIRYGHTDYTKGRERGGFDFNEHDADAIMADFHDRGKDLVIDYDHASVSGGEAPASGWISTLEKGEDGLYAVAEWTPRAAERLKGREYRYHSPVIFFDEKTGHPKALHSVALTNHPAFHNYPALAADDLDGKGDHDIPLNNNPNQGDTMNRHLIKLAGLLGVAIAFTDGKEDEEKTAQLVEEKLQELLSAKTNADAFLAGQSAKTFDDVAGKIAGMKPAADFDKLQQELNAIKAKDLVAQAFSDGKLVESQRKWAEDYAAKNPEGFKAFCDAAQKVAPGPANQVPGGTPAKTETPETFSDGDLAIFAKCGVNKEDVKTNKEGK